MSTEFLEMRESTIICLFIISLFSSYNRDLEYIYWRVSCHWSSYHEIEEAEEGVKVHISSFGHLLHAVCSHEAWSPSCVWSISFIYYFFPILLSFPLDHTLFSFTFMLFSLSPSGSLVGYAWSSAGYFLSHNTFRTCSIWLGRGTNWSCPKPQGRCTNWSCPQPQVTKQTCRFFFSM